MTFFFFLCTEDGSELGKLIFLFCLKNRVGVRVRIRVRAWIRVWVWARVWVWVMVLG